MSSFVGLTTFCLSCVFFDQILISSWLLAHVSRELWANLEYCEACPLNPQNQTTVQTIKMKLDLLHWTSELFHWDQLAFSHLYPLPLLLRFFHFAHHDWVIFALVQYELFSLLQWVEASTESGLIRANLYYSHYLSVIALDYQLLKFSSIFAQYYLFRLSK